MASTLYLSQFLGLHAPYGHFLSPEDFHNRSQLKWVSANWSANMNVYFIYATLAYTKW